VAAADGVETFLRASSPHHAIFHVFSVVILTFIQVVYSFAFCDGSLVGSMYVQYPGFFEPFDVSLLYGNLANGTHIPAIHCVQARARSAPRVPPTCADPRSPADRAPPCMRCALLLLRRRVVFALARNAGAAPQER
jgi:hypothetical protein